MNHGSIKACVAVFVLALSSLAAETQQAAPDLVLLNGKIFTSDAAHPYVQALAIRGEQIAATGDSVKINALAGPHTKRIDLGGRTVIPGINDAHNHLGISPPNRIDLEMKSPDPAWPEMKAAIAAAVLKAPKGTFLYGEIAWKIFRDLAVNRDTLDQVAPNNPVVLQTLTNHAWIMNSAALARCWNSRWPAGPGWWTVRKVTRRKAHRGHPRVCRVRCGAHACRPDQRSGRSCRIAREFCRGRQVGDHDHPGHVE